MSEEAVQAVIGKAALDPKFREALFANPDEALAPFELTEEEVGSLKGVDLEFLELFGETLKNRLSMRLPNPN